MVREFLYRDDLDGSTENVRTFVFAVEGQEYEIDLSEANVQRFHEAVEPFVSKSREVERRTLPARRNRGDGRRRGSGSGSGRPDVSQIREWAMGRNMDVSRRGRIKKEIIDAYDEAHSH
jgi:nucleoid-associated protein Lsr2